MKYLLIPIDNIPDKFIEAVLVETLKFEDNRGLKVQVTPRIIYFTEAPMWPASLFDRKA